MQYYPFDSRNFLYRNKIGALAEGESLRLRLLLHRDACVYDAFLVIRKDDEEKANEIHLNPREWLEDYRFYDCEITLSEGLYWYSFRYTSAHGEFKVCKTDTSLGIVCGEGNSWQQTVFAKDYTTPHWLDGGIIYQIFPDRFFASETAKKDIPNDRYICNDWSKQPEYRQPKDLSDIKRLGNDYYGGDLEGIKEKLDYIADLGVNCIYLNPIFEAHSNHRYNTADYLKIDPMLGDEKALCNLIKEAKKRGIYIILDGVFSHTGDDSIYFNRYKRYKSEGAYQSKLSPYFKWYNFKNYPDKYESWWGIETLPETNENEPSYCEFITGKNGVIRYWLKKGIAGWRLDVADELPDYFLDKVREAVKAESDENFLLGEVWEDASNKISYGNRRRFLNGKQLDSVMNYPFANAIVDFVKGTDAKRLMNCVLDITENYPPQSARLLMNHIGTHDTARILTRLGADYCPDNRQAQAEFKLTPEQYSKAVKLLKLAAVLQYTLVGVPSLYYGDEAGLTGWGDPFCRGGYPWDNEDMQILEFYKKLGKIRRETEAFKDGKFIPFTADTGLIAYIRESENSKVFTAVNSSDCEREITLPKEFENSKSALGETVFNGKLILKPFSYAIIK